MGGALALDAAWLFAAFLVIAIVAAASIAARRFLLERGGGTVECGLRKGTGSWRLGVASYKREELYWFGIFGLSMRPDEVFPRRDLTVVSRRLPTDAEAASLGPGMIVVECKLGDDGGQLGPPAPAGGAAAPRPGGAPASGSGSAASSNGTSDGGTVELALGESALTGLLSWLEAAPPGSHLDGAV